MAQLKLAFLNSDILSCMIPIFASAHKAILTLSGICILAVLGEGKVNLVKKEVTNFYKDNFRTFN